MFFLKTTCVSVVLVFNSEILITMSLFFHFTKKWNFILKQWTKLNKKMTFEYELPKNFNVINYFMLAVYLIMSLSNHIGSSLHSVLSLFNDSEDDHLEITFLPEYNNFFTKFLTVTIFIYQFIL